MAFHGEDDEGQYAGTLEPVATCFFFPAAFPFQKCASRGTGNKTQLHWINEQVEKKEKSGGGGEEESDVWDLGERE